MKEAFHFIHGLLLIFHTCVYWGKWLAKHYFDGLVQDYSSGKSIANAMELLQSWTKPPSNFSVGSSQLNWEPNKQSHWLPMLHLPKSRLNTMPGLFSILHIKTILYAMYHICSPKLEWSSITIITLIYNSMFNSLQLHWLSSFCHILQS